MTLNALKIAQKKLFKTILGYFHCNWRTFGLWNTERMIFAKHLKSSRINPSISKYGEYGE